MYTDLDTLPENVRSALDYDGQVKWKDAYNSVIQKNSKINHRRAVYEAWSVCKGLPSCRYFAGFASSSKIDRQNDSVEAKNALLKIQKQIERGGTITDTHSNRIVGSFYFAELRKTKEGNPGVYVWGVIYQGEPYFDATWSAIKKAVECPHCHDVRKGMSIGGFALDTKISCDGLRCHRDILDMSIHEISVCQEPANPESIIDDVNLMAKSEEVIADGENVMKKSVEADIQNGLDPRENEMEEAVPEEQMAADAEEKAQAVQPTVAPEETESAGLSELTGETGMEGQDDGTTPTVEEIRAFKKKIKNLDRILREVGNIKTILNSADGKETPEANPKVAEGQAPIEGVDKSFAETLVDSTLDAASGDLMSAVAMPGKLITSAAEDVANLATAGKGGAAKGAAKGAQAGKTAGAAKTQASSNIGSSSTTSPTIGKASCGCGMDSDVHTSITDKKCPMPKETYGDQKDPAKMDFLENKNYKDKTNPVKKGGEGGLMDALKLKGVKNAPKSPAVETKEEKKLPEDVMKSEKVVLPKEHLKEDVKEAEGIKETAEDMIEEDEDVLGKAESGAMCEKKFKVKYAPKAKTSFKPAANRLKNIGKEGKDVFMKSEMDESTDQMVEGAEDVVEDHEEQEDMSAQELIDLVINFLKENGIDIELEEEPLETPEVVDVIEKPEDDKENKDQEIMDLLDDENSFNESQMIGKMAMFKFKAKMAETRLNMLSNENILDYLQ